MLAYAIIMFLIAALLAALGIAVYGGRTELIHRYHQTNVTDKEAYARAFGKALLAVAAAPLLSGIIGVLGEKYGAPYNQFPFSMLEANKGGISDWGTICGALYGAAAAFALFWGRKERTPMVNELYRWYEVTKLPIYNPGELAQGVKGDLPSNASGSVLCHISVSKWCAAHKIEATSKARSERCGRLTADVSFKAVEIFNAKIEQGKNYKGTFAVQPAVSGCGECHQTKGNDANWAKGVMDCTPCHNGAEPLLNKFENHP